MACVTRSLDAKPPTSPMRQTRLDAAVGRQIISSKKSPEQMHFGTAAARPDILLPSARMGAGPGGCTYTSLGSQPCSHVASARSATFAPHTSSGFKRSLHAHGKHRYVTSSVPPSARIELPGERMKTSGPNARPKTPAVSLLLSGGRCGR